MSAGKRKKKGSKRSRPDPETQASQPITPEVQRRIVALVFDLAETLCEAESMELVHVEFNREPRGRILRLYIDRPGGVTLDDCVDVSRQLGDLLDVHLEESGAYHLEVSSPGPERPLGRPADFDRFSGRRAKLRLAEPIDGRRNFQGELLGYRDGRVRLKTGEEIRAFPLDDILRARLVNLNGEH